MTGNFPTIAPAPSTNDMNLWGTTGINRTIPTNPMWNVAQFIGELHEGLPSLPLKGLLKERSAKGAAGEYLNLEFGIKPIISDIGDAKKAYLGADARLNELQANSKKRIRRRLQILNETATTSSESMESLFPLFEPTWSGGTALNSVKVTTTITSTRNVWFSGCYSYYFKRSSNSLKRGLQKARSIYGIEPSLSTGWELLPYSWLVDWHANVGEVLENLSAFSHDGLVLRWGYVMCHQSITKEISWPGGYVQFITERKTRTRGNPYGFALKPVDYSGRQLAILGALGITRAPNFGS
jgi:hypothetical protein